jgi:hypothetical protein
MVDGHSNPEQNKRVMIEVPQIIQVLAIFIATLLPTVFVWLFRMYT